MAKKIFRRKKAKHLKTSAAPIAPEATREHPDANSDDPQPEAPSMRRILGLTAPNTGPIPEIDLSDSEKWPELEERQPQRTWPPWISLIPSRNRRVEAVTLVERNMADGKAVSFSNKHCAEITLSSGKKIVVHAKEEHICVHEIEHPFVCPNCPQVPSSSQPPSFI